MGMWTDGQVERRRRMNGWRIMGMRLKKGMGRGDGPFPLGTRLGALPTFDPRAPHSGWVARAMAEDADGELGICMGTVPAIEMGISHSAMGTRI
jgi:hypothetical protein